MAIKYYISFSNHVEDVITANIYHDDYVDDPIPLVAMAPGITIASQSSDDNKLDCGIITKEAVISVYLPVNPTTVLDDFIVDQDKEFRVVIVNESQGYTFLDGYLLIEENSYPFLDIPNTLTLRATDGLNILKGTLFSDANGDPYQQECCDNPFYSILNFFANTLYKLNPNVPIHTFYDVFHELQSDKTDAAFNDGLLRLYVNTKIFLNRSDTAMTDYDAIILILESIKCKLFQENGEWCIVHLYEYLRTDGYAHTLYEYDVISAGVMSLTATDGGLNKIMTCEIGEIKPANLINSDAVRYLKHGTKSVSLQYDYKYPDNQFCNQDFQTATHLDELDEETYYPSEDADGTNDWLGYTEECWTHQRGILGSTTGAVSILPPPFNVTWYIRSEIDSNGREKERIAVIPQQPPASPQGSVLISRPFYIERSDAFKLSFTARVRDGYNGPSNEILASILLEDEDTGTYYTCEWRDWWDDSIRGVWYETLPGGFGTRFIMDDFISSENTGEWSTYDVMTGRVPVSGLVEINFYDRVYNGTGTNESWVKDIRITYYPQAKADTVINSGDINILTNNSSFPNKVSENIKISDAPSRQISGALIRVTDSGDFVLFTPEFHFSGEATNYRFNQLNAYVMYSHVRRVLNKIEGSLKNYHYFEDGTTQQLNCGFLNQYIFSDKWPDKLFMLTGGYELNLMTSHWRGVFVECVADRNDPEFVAPDIYEFKYLFEQE